MYKFADSQPNYSYQDIPEKANGTIYADNKIRIMDFSTDIDKTIAFWHFY